MGVSVQHTLFLLSGAASLRHRHLPGSCCLPELLGVEVGGGWSLDHLTSAQLAMGSSWPTQKTEGARSFPTLSLFFLPLPYMLEFKKLNCLGSQVNSAAVLMVCALIKYCNSNLLYGDKGKRNSRILVALFLVPIILKSMENFCLLLLLWFTITALCRCNFLLSRALLSAQKRLSDEL